MKKVFVSLAATFAFALTPAFAMTWSGDPGPWGPGPMNDCVNTWNTYAYYGYNIPVYYSSGIPTAQANYRGSIGFGGQGNYRTAMHESAHWMGTGTTGEWDLHQRWGTWNGTYVSNLRRAYDGPGERQFIYGVHYGPQGSNYDSEGVQGPQMVGIIGAFRRDQNLEHGDQTIGIAPGTYRLRSRVSVKMLDSLGATAESAQPGQNENGPSLGQRWEVNLILGTQDFTLKNVANGKYLDSLNSATNGSPVAMTSLVGGTPTDSQLWQIVPTDSFFFKIINKANGKALDTLGLTTDGAGVTQWASGGSWNQQWTFMHAMQQVLPPAGVVSQGRWIAASSTDGGNYDTKGNNGVSGDRWTASSGSFPQWWRVDTGMVQPITKVEIDWFSTGAPTFQYRIEVSDNDVNWTVAADRTGNTVTGTTVDRFIASGRFVRVTITGASAGWAAFYECRVYNEATLMRNLSQFRPVTASSEQNGNLAVNANDVDPIFTRWCSNSSGYPGWWQVDLGTAQQVNKAVIQWFDDDGRSYKYRIEGSTDGVNYTTLVDRTGNTTASLTADTFSGLARYVRIYVTGGSSGYPSIYDAQIYGATAPLAPPAPTGFTATGTASQINLSWVAAYGTTSYIVKRSTTSGGPYTTIATPAGTSYSDTTVLVGIPYYYVVTASSDIGTGPSSAEAVGVRGGELHAYLPFDETSGTVAADLSGFGRKGTLTNGPVWAAGNAANAVDLDGTDDYVSLPSGVVSTLNNFTIAAWVKPDVVSAWARVFDFGTNSPTETTGSYMMLSISNGSVPRFAITTSGYNNEQGINGTVALPAGVWSHVAVTLSGNTGTLYVNGAAVNTNTGMTLKPSSLGSPPNNYLGRSQFSGDAYLNGALDEFRIYNRALSVADLARLRGAVVPLAPTSLAARAEDSQITLSWSPALGATSYNVKRSTTGGEPYTTIATLNAAGYSDTGLTNDTPYYYVVSAVNAAGQSVANSPQATATPVASAPATPAAPGVITPYEVGTQVKLAWSATSGATSYNLKRSTTSGGPYTTIANVAGTGYTDSAVTLGTTYYYVVSAIDASGEGGNSLQASALPSAAVPAVYLKMNETTGTTAGDESGNGWNGTLVNGPTHIAGRLNAGIGFDGSNDHVTLPSGVVSTLNDCTISAWVRPTTLSAWARVFDFGTGTDNTMYLTVQGGTGKPVFSIRTPSTPSQEINSSVALTLNTWTHVAVTISGSTGTLYVNGAVVGGNGTMSLNPSSLGSTTLNYLGRSQFADPYFTGWLDEFQIRNRALTATEVAALAAPPLVPTGVAATAGTQQVSLAWNAVSGATGYLIKRGTVSGGPYTTIATDLVTLNYTDTGLTGGTTYYYIVIAQKQLAEGPNSSQVSATPQAPPAAPTDLSATAVSDTQIDLSWTASAGATSYNVKRATFVSGPYTTIATGVAGTAYPDTGLTGSTTYYYMVSAVNAGGEGANSAPASATTQSSLTPAEQWRQAHFGTTANAGDAADDADPEGDGVKNLLERAFGGDPNVADPGILPAIDDEAPLLSIIYRKALAATDLVFAVKESTGLASWDPADGTPELVSDDGTVQVFRFTRSVGTDDKLFLRVEVTGP